MTVETGSLTALAALADVLLFRLFTVRPELFTLTHEETTDRDCLVSCRIARCTLSYGVCKSFMLIIVVVVLVEKS